MGTATDKVYHLSFAPLDETAVEAELLQSDGSWKTLAEGRGFSVHREAGLVTFTTAPGASPVSGQDNVKITAARTVEGYAERIGHCDTGILLSLIHISRSPASRRTRWTRPAWATPAPRR